MDFTMTKRRLKGVGLLCALILAVVSAPAVAQESSTEESEAPVADRDFFAQVDGNFAVFNDSPGRSIFSGGFGYNLRAGWRFEDLGVFLQGGQALWFATAVEQSLEPGVLNLGVGAEYRFLGEQLRSSAAAGSSTLLFDATLDDAGTTGWFLNLRPLGLRWALSDRFTIELDPLTFLVMQPVMDDPGLTKIEYQTVLAFEVQ